MMKKIFLGLILSLSIFSLASCNNKKEEIKNDKNDQNEEIKNDNKIDNSLSIVVYYSATSHTENVAKYISEYTNSNIYELVPKQKYTSADLNYGNSNSRVVKEHNDLNRHVELESTTFDGFSEAKYIYIGAPVWWQELSWVIDDFIKDNDFSGKTIIPFATSASSSYTTTKLQAYTTDAVWMSPQRFSSNTMKTTVINWIDSLGIYEK